MSPLPRHVLEAESHWKGLRVRPASYTAREAETQEGKPLHGAPAPWRPSWDASQVLSPRGEAGPSPGPQCWTWVQGYRRGCPLGHHLPGPLGCTLQIRVLSQGQQERPQAPAKHCDRGVSCTPGGVSEKRRLERPQRSGSPSRGPLCSPGLRCSGLCVSRVRDSGRRGQVS